MIPWDHLIAFTALYGSLYMGGHTARSITSVLRPISPPARKVIAVDRTVAGGRGTDRWSLTTVREKFVKIGAKILCHGRHVTFQMAKVAVPGGLFRDILSLNDGLRRPSLAAG